MPPGWSHTGEHKTARVMKQSADVRGAARILQRAAGITRGKILCRNVVINAI